MCGRKECVCGGREGRREREECVLEFGMLSCVSREYVWREGWSVCGGRGVCVEGGREVGECVEGGREEGECVERGREKGSVCGGR